MLAIDSLFDWQGEYIHDGAIREVKEETGVCKVKMIIERKIITDI